MSFWKIIEAWKCSSLKNGNERNLIKEKNVSNKKNSLKIYLREKNMSMTCLILGWNNYVC